MKQAFNNMYLINYENDYYYKIKKPTQKTEWENCYEKECDLSITLQIYFEYLINQL